ncbi:CCRG-2 family RiPP [Prochlorococcus marinus]|uniref:CCRG-2 family RiPP n=1 Tax=Prochlorococcus marinus TaxID=1219 RepID=UPI0012FF2072
MANNELTIDQLKVITGRGPLRGLTDVSAEGVKTNVMRDTVDSCNVARPSWHKISKPWNHPR